VLRLPPSLPELPAPRWFAPPEPESPKRCQPSPEVAAAAALERENDDGAPPRASFAPALAPKRAALF
jgi:hypothetical protein